MFEHRGYRDDCSITSVEDFLDEIEILSQFDVPPPGDPTQCGTCCAPLARPLPIQILEPNIEPNPKPQPRALKVRTKKRTGAKDADSAMGQSQRTR